MGTVPRVMTVSILRRIDGHGVPPICHPRKDRTPGHHCSQDTRPTANGKEIAEKLKVRDVFFKEKKGKWGRLPCFPKSKT